ncbi:MFS transporter [Brachybacterium sp. J144]|uniref:MFS transporter n=1 Tax=Brachybacterium sp. J144 TaxID=3116487 RepID=UPI002E77AF36|nr:MFS transporter [Brachybacterium sp. J144]MEE1651149.1 MFS transporter [Brachybacterium sp. J144]
MTTAIPRPSPVPRLLVPASALLWGLHSSLLSPALALILATLYDASTADIGWTLAIYNAGGFLAALVLPAWADRRRNYLALLMAAAGLTIALAAALAVATTLPWATLALVVLGGPAGLGTTMLFAHLRDAGESTSSIVNTRAIISAAWMGGPPLATVIIGWVGPRGILLALVVIAVANIATAAVMISRRHAQSEEAAVPARSPHGLPPGSRAATLLIIGAFVLFQATNATAMTFMTLYVTQTVGLPVLWAGVALGLTAALEVPALVMAGRLGERTSHLRLVAVGALLSAVYYAGLVIVTEPVLLLVLQIPNALGFAAISGIGLALFQDMIPGAGVSTGLFMNARRVGAVLSGPIIAAGVLPLLGQRGVFVICAVLTLAGLALIPLAKRLAAPPETAAVAE